MNQATLTFDKVSDPKVVITLQGSWTVSGVLPALDQLSALPDYDQLKTVAFITGDDFSWDSRLLAWLLACQRMLEPSHCQLDLSGLPEDVKDLFRLANTVPPNKALPDRNPSLLHRLVDRVARLGDEAMELLAFIGELALSLCRWLSRKGSARWSDIISFCHQSGPSALPIITLQSVLIGMILAYLGMVQLRQFGAEVYVANLVGVGMVREMGALMTAVIMSGRTGAAYAAQLGTMQVNEEIDALTTLGIKPMDYLVLPRTLALILTIPLLCLYSNILGMLGGSRLRIQVHFKKDLSNSGLPLHTLQKKYAISGNLLFDDDAMVKKVISMPARCFLKEAQQHTPPNPIHLAKNSIKIFKKDSTTQHLLHIPILTKDQQKVYNTITSLFNKLLDSNIVSLKGTPRAKSTLQGQACCHLKSGQLLFISFKIPATEIDQRVDPSVYLKQGNIRGRLRYDPKWLFSKISNNSTLLHSSHPGILPDENKIFFLAKSITLYFEDPSRSSTS